MLALLLDPGPKIEPQNIEEKLVYWSLVGTWGLYFGGAIFTAPPVIGYILAFISVKRLMGYEPTPYGIRKSIPAGVLVWFAGMIVMVISLFVGHVDFGFGAPEIIKSFVGWMKGWALIAVFMFCGATLRIRPKIIVRASNILALQTLILVPIFLGAAIAHLPRTLFVSPLGLLGGPGPEFFTVELYGIEPMTNSPRWRFFAPWAPAAGLVCSMGFVLALHDKCLKWKIFGILGALAMCVMSAARMAMVAIPVIPTLVFIFGNLTRPFIYGLGFSGILLLLPFTTAIVSGVEDLINAFLNARSDSTRVRATLQRIAQHRWAEAPWWGHATVERGPHLVEYMPIGTHHTWNGLLFVKGTVGFVALLVPMVWTTIELVLKAQSDRYARIALGQFLIVLLFSFGENLESLIYLYWHGMILVGIAMSRRFCNPFRGYLGRRIAQA